MSFVDWNAAALPGQIAGQQNQNAAQQLDMVQRNRALNALHGVNLGDQGSVQNALNGLTQLGMVDQAKGLTDLAQTRAVNSAALPVVQSALGEAQSSMQPDQQPQAPDLDAAHRQILQQASDATTDLMNYADPTLRAAAADVYKQKFAQMGIPKRNIDEVLGDLSDQGLKQHEAYFQSYLNGDGSVPHPTGNAASQDVFNANNPGGSQAAATLQGHLTNPIVQAALAKAGIDISPGINQAISITGPARAAAAGAPYNEVTLQGPNNEPVQMSQANFAAGQAQPGARPVVGATPGNVASQTAAASAPYTPVHVPGPGGQDTVESAAQFASGRGAPLNTATPNGPANAPPIQGPTIAGAAGLAGGANVNVKAAQDLEGRAGEVPMRKANLSNLSQTASEFTAGPQSGFWEHLGAIAAEYGITPPAPIPGGNAVAAQTEFRKVATAVLASQRATMGLPVTDQSVSLTTGASPNDTLTPQGIQRVVGIMQGNEDYLAAERQAWQSWKDQGHGYETFAQFQPQWNKMFDPRVFQAQYMTPPEAQKVQKSIPNYTAQMKAAERLGYIAGQ